MTAASRVIQLRFIILLAMRLQLAACLLAWLSTFHVSATQEWNFTLQLPHQRPAWAEKLSPNLIAFSLELDRWPYWAGEAVGKPNNYFHQLLRNLADRTGHMAFLRVGGNSVDRATVDLGIEVMDAIFPLPTEGEPNPEAQHVFIGRDFYALSGNLPPGNEPDFFGLTRSPVNGSLGRDWDVANYTATWLEFASTISSMIDFNCSNPDSPKLYPGTFTSWEAPEWTPEGTFTAGLLENGGIRCKISHWNQHLYSSAFDPRRVVRPGELMDKIFIRANLSSRTSGRIAARSAGLGYVMGETNSVARHGQPGLSNTVEAALWTTDYLLLCASYGVERVYLHQGVGYRYSAIQPIWDAGDGLNISRPHILPSYNALLVVNEAIGESRDAFVAELPTTNVTLTAYGIWEGEQLMRLVVLNTQVYLGTGEKSSINVTLNGLSLAGRSTLKRLQSEKTTAYTGVTWAGQSFETASGKPQGKVTEEIVLGTSFNLPASSIVLVTLRDK
ncbi:uncharacterized protein A1O9_12355 [Exophiala aquamarina CBS 119918]|uniref:Beta-glucuronidase C-terminal domain-containing protein n=1 Tax=Exophiala aquamarina CBS 119918 TaxID=1182545 RepID=A0A072P7Z5_9EURO|nr:uncharacterized protein A1O9_12355 [Exophiala aquamarina CBS 119918]KEF51720.1 hypothetical protein A1O9_12355 [Exophiala aquamarina CBS 119918]